jgi:tripartite-type tricarboxylate transporter receptor subunit TctC
MNRTTLSIALMAVASLAAAIDCALAASSNDTSAANYPTKSIRFVVPFAPGGGTDVTARVIAQKLSDALGKPVVVDNRGGAGGVIGADMVAKAPPDGYTILLGSPGPLTINPALLPKMPYDSLKDFAPVSLATISPFVLTINPSVPAASVKELIALAKAKPGALRYASGGNGSVAHLSTEQFKSLAHIDLTHVPYKGSGQSIVDVIAGRVEIMFDNQPVLLPHIRSGKLRGLAVGTRTRSSVLPELPTMVEAGVPGYESSTAFGVLAPAKTPRPIVNRLSKEIAQSLKSAPEVKDALASRGFEPVGSTPEEYAAHIRDEMKRIAEVVKRANIKLD